MFQFTHCIRPSPSRFAIFVPFFFEVRRADEWQSTCSTSIERKELDGVNFTSPHLARFGSS